MCTFIKNEPINEVYEALVDFGFEVCHEFILVVRKDMSFSDQGKAIIKSLQGSLKFIKEQWEWPGTEFFGELPAEVYYYRTDDSAKNIIKEAVKSLYSWVQPDFPEDLCLLKNGETWLMNIAHENESYICTKDKRELDKLKNMGCI